MEMTSSKKNPNNILIKNENTYISADKNDLEYSVMKCSDDSAIYRVRKSKIFYNKQYQKKQPILFRLYDAFGMRSYEYEGQTRYIFILEKTNLKQLHLR